MNQKSRNIPGKKKKKGGSRKRPDAAPQRKKAKAAVPAQEPSKAALLKRCDLLKEQIRRHPEDPNKPLELEAARAELAAVQCGAWGVVHIALLDDVWRLLELRDIHEEVAHMLLGLRSALRLHDAEVEVEATRSQAALADSSAEAEGTNSQESARAMALPFSFPAPAFLLGRSYGALHCAALCGDVALVKRFSAKDSGYAHTHTQHGSTALHLACLFAEHAGHREAALLLCERLPQELIDARNSDGESALLLAVQAGAAKLCKALLGRGASVCEEALMSGFGQGDVDIASRLLAASPKDTVAGMAGALLCQAAEAAATDAIAFHAYTGLIDLLTGTDAGQYGVDVNARVPDSWQTCLHAACREQSVTPVAVDLVGRGADPEARDANGNRPVDLLTRMEKDTLRDMFRFHAWYWEKAPAPPDPQFHTHTPGLES